MSYEGLEHRLCEKGHLDTQDALTAMHEPELMRKPCWCTARFALSFSQDQTNGYYEEDPRTHNPKLIQIGFDDIPMEDHRGNKYVGMARRFAPQPNSGQVWHNLLEEL